MIESIKSSIEGFKLLITDDFSCYSDVTTRAENKIKSLEILAEENDEEAIEGIKLLKTFLHECGKYAEKMNKLQQKETLYEETLRKIQSPAQKEFVLKKLEQIEAEKKKFYA